MSFDRSNTDDVQQLNTELTTDPILMGYDLNGSHRAMADLLNDPGANTQVNTDTINPVSGFDTLEACKAYPSEYKAAVTDDVDSDLHRSICETFFNLRDEPVPERFKDELISNTGIFTNGTAPNIRNTLIDFATRQRTRGEVLYGDFTRINEQDISTALDFEG